MNMSSKKMLPGGTLVKKRIFIYFYEINFVNQTLGKKQ